jgi:plastocyanin
MRTPAALVLLLLFVLPASGTPLRRLCQRQCKEEITSCVHTGHRRPRCRRDTLRRCRQEGIAVCAAPPSTTTTTIGGGSGTVNGCHPTTAADLRGQPQVTVTFGDADGFRYVPPCFKVSPGTEVTFTGNFGFHPLVGGEIVGTTKVPDGTSPFAPTTNTGATKAFMLTESGTLPFYCDFHGVAFQMKGAVFVGP